MRRLHCCILITSLLVCMSLSGQEQSTVLHGNVPYIKGGERLLMIQYRKLAGGFIFDSTIITHGAFRIERKISEPLIAAVSIKEPAANGQRGGSFDYISVYLMPGKELVLDATEKLGSATFSGSGSVANSEYQDYLKKSNAAIKAGNQLRTQLRADKLEPAVYGAKMAALNDSLSAITDESNRQLFLKNPNSPVGVYALLQYAGEPVWTPRKKMIPEEIEKYVKLLPRTVMSYPSITALIEELEVSKATGPGRKIIDFTLADAKGKRVKLSDFKGQYVFLDFWASWCAPCRKENPNVKTQYEKYKGNGFTVLSVSLDKPDAREAWLEAIQKDQIGMFTHVSDLKGFDSPVAREYYVRSIPTNFLISPDGKFVNRNLYGESLNKALEKIFDK
jgi:peroxiredoxin